MVGKKKIQVVYWKYRHDLQNKTKNYICGRFISIITSRMSDIWYFVLYYFPDITLQLACLSINIEWHNLCLGSHVRIRFEQQSFFFQQLYLQSTVRRDFLPLGDLQTWKVMTALILGFPANLLLLLTGDVTPTQTIAWWNHRRYEGRQISHTRWHTSHSATSGHLLEDLLPDLLHLANQNSAGCYLITQFIVSHHLRLHWPFHFFFFRPFFASSF